LQAISLAVTKLQLQSETSSLNILPFICFDGNLTQLQTPAEGAMFQVKSPVSP